MASAVNDGGVNAPPYAGLRVVELADTPAGEHTGKLLAEMGAEVIKIEPPEGAASRRLGPFVDGREDGEHSLVYWYYNTSKRSVVLDFRSPGGAARVRSLLAGADVLITTLQPAEAQKLGLAAAPLLDGFPRLIVLSVTPFGLDGPWADYRGSDLINLAAGGPLHTCGYDDHALPPILPGGGQSYHIASAFAHTSLLLAVIERQQTGRGQLVDVSIHESCAVTIELAFPYWVYQRSLVYRQTCRHAAPVRTQQAIYLCGDGRWVYFVLIIAEQKAWESLVDWLDSKGLAVDLVDEAYRDVRYRQQQFGHIQEVVESFALLHDAETIYREGQERGLPIGLIYAPEDLPHDRQLVARDFFVTLQHDDAPPGLYPGAPYRFSAYRWELRRRAPNLGEHSDEVLAALPAV